MSKQPSTTAIGAFVAGAIALTVGALIMFGSGRFFDQSFQCILYFDGSVQGLNQGSPVNFKGVQVGEVTEIQLQFNAEDLSIKIPVLTEIYPEKLTMTRGRRDAENLKRLIDHGLRAQLKTQSLITGQLMIELNFHPDKPLRFSGDGAIPEIPTIPTAIEELTKTLADIPFAEIMQKLTSAVEGIERIINSPELGSSLRSLDDTLKEMQGLIRTMDSTIDPLARNVNSTVEEYGRLAKTINEEVDTISAVLGRALTTAQAASKKAEKVLDNTAKITAEGSPAMYEFTKALQGLSDAARALRSMADYMERHPESLIFGKGGSR